MPAELLFPWIPRHIAVAFLCVALFLLAVALVLGAEWLGAAIALIATLVTAFWAQRIWPPRDEEAAA